MTYKEKDGLRILDADQGKYIANKDKTEFLGVRIYLGKYSKPEDYAEIIEEEKIAIEKKEEAKRKVEETKNRLDKE